MKRFVWLCISTGCPSSDFFLCFFSYIRHNIFGITHAVLQNRRLKHNILNRLKVTEPLFNIYAVCVVGKGCGYKTGRLSNNFRTTRGPKKGLFIACGRLGKEEEDK